MTSDGGETDLDLGHYERFIDVELTRSSNLTAGDVYSTLIAKERRGDFLGGTIQAVPHVTAVIKERITSLGDEQGRGRGGRRGGRHGGRHRRASLPGSHPPDPQRRGAGQCFLHPPDPAALPGRGPGAKDQADTAQRQGAALNRHPARCHTVPQRASRHGLHPAENIVILRCAGTRGHSLDYRRQRVRGAHHPRGGGPWGHNHRVPGADGPCLRHGRLGGDGPRG